ncbi:MAG: GNAT family N-acetyltransferase [Gammaproteobacteria bacterium]
MTLTFPLKHVAPTARDALEPSRQASAGISVTSLDGITALERFASEIDRLNLASARPNPFLSSAFLVCYALHMEYYTPGRDERLFLIWQGERLIGCAPMRRSFDYFGLPAGPMRPRGVSFQFLAPLDTDQPGILAAPEDEARVASALIHHICEKERGWGMLEFAGQRPGTALHCAVYAAAGRNFRAREINVNPYYEIGVVWKDLNDYFRSLAKKMRSNISRQARRLFAAGEPEIVLATGAAAVTPWFDAYCELDSRSWKHGTDSSIQRHPRRVRFYREIAAGKAGLDPGFIGIVLDGVLVAGLFYGSNATASPDYHGAWCLEMAYDQSRAELGPGQLLLLLAVGQAIEKGHRLLNFMQNFAYFKHRWAAEPINVVNVRLIRRMSMRNVCTSLGDLRRKMQARHERIDDPAEEESTDRPAVAAVNEDRARALTQVARAYAGAGLRRLNRTESCAYLPFDLE